MKTDNGLNENTDYLFICSGTKLCPTLLTPSTASGQALLPFTIFWSLLKFMSIESVMLSDHLILCHTLFLTAKEGGCFPNQMLENLFCGMNEQGTNIALGVSYRMK